MTPNGRFGVRLFVKLEMAAPGMGKPLKLTVPPLPPSHRTPARQLAAALPRLRA